MRDKPINDKLDKVVDAIDRIEVTQIVHTEQLKEHMRRTALLEEALTSHEDADIDALKDIAKKLEPMNEFLSQMQGIKKLIWLLGAIIGLAVAFKDLL